MKYLLTYRAVYPPHHPGQSEDYSTEHGRHFRPAFQFQLIITTIMYLPLVSCIFLIYAIESFSVNLYSFKSYCFIINIGA